MDINSLQKSINIALTDKVTPNKIDKKEAQEIKDLFKNQKLSDSEKILIKDQIKTSKVEQGQATTILKGLFDNKDISDNKKEIKNVSEESLSDLKRIYSLKTVYSHKDFVKRANTLCDNTTTKLNILMEKAQKDPDSKEIYLIAKKALKNNSLIIRSKSLDITEQRVDNLSKAFSDILKEIK
jgi:hypothetical protein